MNDERAKSIYFGWGVVIDDPRPVMLRATGGVSVLGDVFLSRRKFDAESLATKCHGRAVRVRVVIEEVTADQTTEALTNAAAKALERAGETSERQR